jgi:hypothetical protein
MRRPPTTRKHAKDPPKKYQYEDDLVLILALVQGHLHADTFELDQKGPFGIGW